MNSSSQHILLIEDDRPLGLQLRRGLLNDGYVVSWVTRLQDATDKLQRESFQFIILDWMLPDGDGVEWLKKIRVLGVGTPVILLTARSQVEDKVRGLDAGADDYLAKPFALAELLARLRTLLRRRQSSDSKELKIGDLTLDLLSRKLIDSQNRTVELTPKEYDFLACLAVHCCEAVSRDTLAREVWQGEGRYTSLDNVIDVHVTNLRRKLKQLIGTDPIITVRGVGFRLLINDRTSDNEIQSSN
ncbi:MAG: response regulator transcription factor [Verrucomicrobia bacterium]|nr:response regulator transcription factor [Verrucomicrobiota bacterium]